VQDACGHVKLYVAFYQRYIFASLTLLDGRINALLLVS